MQKILIPTNLTVLGDFAYGFARKIAAQTNATIQAVYIAVTHGNAIFDKEGNLAPHQEFDVSHIKSEMDEADKKLKEWAADKPEITKTIVTAGHLVDTINNIAIREEADLIVMGTEGSFGLKEWTIGSVAEKVVRLASIPVLTLKCDRDQLSINDILYVGDFESAAPVNIQMIKTIQKAFKARLHLLKINTKNDFLSDREVKAHMHLFVENNELDNVEFHTYSDNSIEEGIRHFCEDFHVDFVTMSTQGRKGVSRILQGSVAEKVVNHVFQPILTFKG